MGFKHYHKNQVLKQQAKNSDNFSTKKHYLNTFLDLKTNLDMLVNFITKLTHLDQDMFRVLFESILESGYSYIRINSNTNTNNYDILMSKYINPYKEKTLVCSFVKR